MGSISLPFGELVDLLLSDQEVDCHAFMEQVFTQYRKIADFSSAVFLSLDPLSFEMQCGTQFEIDEARGTEYLEHFAPHDPFVLNGPTPATLNRVYRFSDVAATITDWQRKFGEFMDRVPYRHALAALVGFAGRPLGVVSIHRTYRSPDFDDYDMQIFARTVKYLAMGALWRLSSAAHTIAPTTTPDGCFMIDQRGRILWIDATAEHLLARLGLNAREIFRLAGRSAPVLTPVGTFLASAVPVTRATAFQGGADTRSACAGSALARIDRSPAQPLATAAHIVRLSPMSTAVDIAASLTSSGLTPAELRVARLLVAGLAHKQIAQAIGVEQCTIKKHATHIMPKQVS